MKRNLLAFALALGAIGFLAAPPAQAATKEGSAVLGYDYATGSGGVTLNSFTEACHAGMTEDFMDSPFQGVDAYVFDLGSEKMGAFSVKGPGADPVGPNIPVFDIQATTYDLDLHFRTAECEDANVADYGERCYSTNPTPDEKTSCIRGVKKGGKVHGARYVIVTLSLNLTGAPVPFKLTHP